jgi:hypothetical protein
MHVRHRRFRLAFRDLAADAANTSFEKAPISTWSSSQVRTAAGRPRPAAGSLTGLLGVTSRLPVTGTTFVEAVAGDALEAPPEMARAAFARASLRTTMNQTPFERKARESKNLFTYFSPIVTMRCCRGGGGDASEA